MRDMPYTVTMQPDDVAQDPAQRGAALHPAGDYASQETARLAIGDYVLGFSGHKIHSGRIALIGPDYREQEAWHIYVKNRSVRICHQ